MCSSTTENASSSAPSKLITVYFSAHVLGRMRPCAAVSVICTASSEQHPHASAAAEHFSVTASTAPSLRNPEHQHDSRTKIQTLFSAEKVLGRRRASVSGVNDTTGTQRSQGQASTRVLLSDRFVCSVIWRIIAALCDREGHVPERTRAIHNTKLSSFSNILG